MKIKLKIKIFVFTALFLFVFNCVTQASLIEINIKDSVVLSEKTITIDDISTVIGVDNELVDSIKSVEIGKTPWPNNKRRIDANYLRMRLSSLHINLSDIVFNGAKVTTVVVESSKITGSEIAQIAKEYLMSVIPLDGRETTVEMQRMPVDQWVARKRDELILGASLVDPSRIRGNVGVIVNAFSNDGIAFFKIAVFFKVRVFEYVAIAKRKINRHQPLNEENVFIGRRETTKAQGVTFFRIEDLVNKAAVRTIIPNTIITEYIVETPPTIFKDDMVKIYMKSGNFKIVTKGLAQENGYTGKIIRVKSIDSKKVFYGRVIDHENVQIIY